MKLHASARARASVKASTKPVTSSSATAQPVVKVQTRATTRVRVKPSILQGSDAGSPSLFDNGNFLDFTGGLPRGFASDTAAVLTVTQDYGVTHTPGLPSLKIVTDAGGPSSQALRQIKSLKGGKTYIAEVWARTDGGPNSRPQLDWRNETSGTTASVTGTLSGTVWERLTATFFIATTGNFRIRLRFSNAANGSTVYFSELTVREFTPRDLIGGHSPSAKATTVDFTGPNPRATGYYGSEAAYSFDGTNDSVLLGTGVDLMPSSDASLEVVFQHVGTASTRCIYGSSGDQQYWMLRLDGTHHPVLVSDKGGGGSLTSSVAVPANTWAHVVAVIDPDGTARIYVNGIVRATGSILIDTPGVANRAFGYRPEATDQFFGGRLALGRLYKRALTAADVAYLYSCFVAGKRPSLFALPGDAPIPSCVLALDFNEASNP